jgi:alkylhydroperoxidase family enzyme
MLVHGAVLRKNFFTVEQVLAILEDYHQAGLDPVEVDLMDFATQITRDAGSVTPEGIRKLRADGLSDAEILDVTLAAAARNFFSRVLDALGTEPDASLRETEPELWQRLMEVH